MQVQQLQTLSTITAVRDRNFCLHLHRMGPFPSFRKCCTSPASSRWVRVRVALPCNTLGKMATTWRCMLPTPSASPESRYMRQSPRSAPSCMCVLQIQHVFYAGCSVSFSVAVQPDMRVAAFLTPGIATKLCNTASIPRRCRLMPRKSARFPMLAAAANRCLCVNWWRETNATDLNHGSQKEREIGVCTLL